MCPVTRKQASLAGPKQSMPMVLAVFRCMLMMFMLTSWKPRYGCSLSHRHTMATMPPENDLVAL